MSETPDQAATRRRWITLAEVVAVAGVVIAALTLWNSWSERRAADQERTAAIRSETAAKTRLDLTGTIRDGGRELLLKDAQHDMQSVTIAFPRALGLARQEPAADPIIDSRAFAPVILKLTDGGPDDRTGRLPVLITASYVDGDATRTVGGVYDVVWRTGGRLLRGRDLRVEALKLHQRGGTQATVDALWARMKP